MDKALTSDELADRRRRFIERMMLVHPGWETALLAGRVNQYYFTGTMQDGLLVIKNGGELGYFVRRSYERAREESPLDSIYPMQSYRDVLDVFSGSCGATFVETEIMTVAMLERVKKYLPIDSIGSVDKTVLGVRAVKSPFELALMEESGQQHFKMATQVIPALLREGMSEVDFVAELTERMLKNGYQGITRFQMFQTEVGIGQVGFGTSSLYPTSFDGPGGSRGISPAVPLIGSRERKLKKGDLVFVDTGYGIDGYHSDKTQVYSFGAKPHDNVVRAHRMCMEIQKRTAALLTPGARPGDIYQAIIGSLDASFLKNFMGLGARQARFLGHGIGLHVDEPPVIARGFDDPLEAHMVIALEPKKGIEGAGMVGVEDTYIVTPDGGRCITGGGADIIEVY
ncbi:aminopeptidase P family protein [Oscillospiraceae bacterium CM]|nr:aminopeptidase P family protein [Oscillospiraceae bacterium CM]